MSLEAVSSLRVVPLTLSAPSSAWPQEVNTVMAVSQYRAPWSGEREIKEAG